MIVRKGSLEGGSKGGEGGKVKTDEIGEVNARKVSDVKKKSCFENREKRLGPPPFIGSRLKGDRKKGEMNLT